MFAAGGLFSTAGIGCRNKEKEKIKLVFLFLL